MTSPVGSERAVHDTTDWLRTGLVDPTEPGFLSDPYARYAIAREVAPVQQHSNGVYMLFAYDDVKRALADKSLSSSEQYALEAPRNMRIKAAGGSDAYLLRPSLSKLDPPDHLALRKLLARSRPGQSSVTTRGRRKSSTSCLPIMDGAPRSSW